MPGIWPGQAPGYTAPTGGLVSAIGQQSLFSEYGGPRYTGPFNVNLGNGLLNTAGQLAAPMLLQGLVGPDRIPLQFNPQQSVFDQLQSNQFFSQQQQSMRLAARRDQRGLSELVGGINQSLQKEPLESWQISRNNRVAEGISAQLPLLAQMSPDITDQLFGRRGSSTVMAQQLQQTFRTAMDPVTGRMGFTPESTNAATENIFETLYGPLANPSSMRGLSAGQAGMLANQLQTRGLLSPMLGNLSMGERIQSLPENLQDAQVTRIAERIPSQPGGRSLTEMRDAGEEITQKMIEQAKDKVLATLERMKGAAPALSDTELAQIYSTEDVGTLKQRRRQLAAGLDEADFKTLTEGITLNDAGDSLASLRKRGVQPTDAQRQFAQRGAEDIQVRAQRDLLTQEVQRMPGGEDILRASDANRITQRLKNLSGAVAAMQEIFGDMGQEGTIPELVAGLDALTQGGLATMTPGQLEAIVRRTQSVANQTGMGFQTQQMLAAGNQQLATQLGLTPTAPWGLRATQQSAAFGKALEDTQRLDMPVWGALSRDQLILADQQLRVQAAASPLANQLGAVMRLRDQGLLDDVAPDSELGTMIQAIEDKKPTYRFGGQNRTVAMKRGTLQNLLNRDAGISFTQSQTAIFDRMGNQEYIQKYGFDAFVRAQQTSDAIQNVFTPNISGRIGNTLVEEGIDKSLADAGVNPDSEDFLRMMDEVGRGVATDFFEKLKPEEVRGDPKKRQEAIGRIFRDRLRTSIQRRMPDADPAEVDRLTEQTVTQMGGERGLSLMGSTVFDTINQTAGRQGLLQNAIGAYDILNPRAQKRFTERERLLEAEDLTRQALGGLAQEKPLRKITDALRDVGPGTTFQDVLGKAVGGVNIGEILSRDPKGQVQSMLNLLKTNRDDLDPNDPKQMEQIRRNARMIQGMLDGGPAAKRALQEAEADEKTDPVLLENLRKAVEGRETIMRTLQDAGAKLPDQPGASGEEGRSIEDAEKAMKLISGGVNRTNPPSGDKQPEELRVHVTGTFKEEDDGRLSIDGWGRGAYEAITGMFS